MTPSTNQTSPSIPGASWRRRLGGLSLALVLALMATPAVGGTLENLERERAALLSVLLEPGVDPAERAERADTIVRRLVDLERLVLRDDSLPASPDADVARAFESYDRTFLVHAATEQDQPVLSHWLAEIGLGSGAIRGARLGRR